MIADKLSVYEVAGFTVRAGLVVELDLAAGIVRLQGVSEVVDFSVEPSWFTPRIEHLTPEVGGYVILAGEHDSTPKFFPRAGFLRLHTLQETP